MPLKVKEDENEILWKVKGKCVKNKGNPSALDQPT